MPDHPSPPTVATAAPNQQLAAADALFNDGAVAAAETAYLALIAAAPSSWPAYIGATRCARNRGDRATSLRYLDQAAAALPGDVRVVFERAMDLQGLRRFSEAECEFQAAIDLAPQNIRAWLGFGQCARQRGDLQTSLARFRAGAAIDPANPPLQLEIANDLREIGQIEAAETVLVDLLRRLPGHIGAIRGLAICARRRGDRELALHWFRQAGAAQPNNRQWSLEIAGELRELSRMDEAEAEFQAILKQAPGDLQALLGLGLCARKRNDRVLSLHWFSEAVAADSTSVPARQAMAVDLRDAGQTAEAAAAFRQILAEVPDHIPALRGIAGCARKNGDILGALNWAREAAALAPDDAQVQLEIAADLRQLGRIDEAEATLRRLLATAPDHIEAHLSLGQCARKRGNARAAADIFQAAMAIAPVDPRPMLEYAAQLRDLGAFAAAESLYRQLLEAKPTHTGPARAQAHHGLGHIARSRDDRAAALRHFQAAAEANPGDPSAPLEIAAELRDAGDAAAARQQAAAVLRAHPGNLHAMMSLGQTERHAGQGEAALAAFRTAHEAAPANPEPLVEMAVELRRLGHQQECDALLAKALELNPNSLSALSRLAEQALTARDLETAYGWYQRALAAEPAAIAAQLGAAECLARMARHEEALALLAALQEARGPLPVILCKRLGLLRQAGDYPRARQLAREATQLAPHAFQVWVERFHCEMLAGADADIADCLRALTPGTLHQRASTHRLQGIFAESQLRYDDAAAHYVAGLGCNPEDSAMQTYFVRCKLMTFELAEALRHLRRLLEMTRHLNRLQNGPRNVSQYLYGEILDEFCLDAELAEDLRTLQAVPPADRIPRICALIRANPDNTASAVALLIALRQAGQLGVRPHPPSKAAEIPKTIVQYWDDADVPADVARLMEGWRAHNPDYTHQLFNDETARAYLQQYFPPQVLLAYRRGRVATQKSDIFRLAYFALEGGVYADADDRCLGPISTLIAPSTELLLYQEDVCSAANNFFAVRPRHPVLVKALNLAVEAINRGDTDSVWLSTGPGLMTRALSGHLAESLDQRGALPPGITILDIRQLQLRVAAGCLLGYKQTDQYWLNAAVAKRRASAGAEG